MVRRLLPLVLLLVSATALAQVPDKPRAAARGGRLSFGLGGGIASVSMDDSPASMWHTALIASNPAVAFGAVPESKIAYQAGVSLRAYLPLHILLEAGYETLYSHASSEYSMFGGTIAGSETVDNLVMDVPLMAGVHFSLGTNVFVHVAAGVNRSFFGRSFWETDNGGLPDLSADGTWGYNAAAAFTWLAGDDLALELEVRYRKLRLEPTRDENDTIINQIGGDHYALDFSGLGAALNLRAFF